MTPDLLPCPFCGEHRTDKLIVHENYGDAWVRCFTCGTTGPERDDGSAKAISAWNTRVVYERAKGGES